MSLFPAEMRHVNRGHRVGGRDAKNVSAVHFVQQLAGPQDREWAQETAEIGSFFGMT